MSFLTTINVDIVSCIFLVKIPFESGGFHVHRAIRFVPGSWVIGSRGFNQEAHWLSTLAGALYGRRNANLFFATGAWNHRGSQGYCSRGSKECHRFFVLILFVIITVTDSANATALPPIVS
jgi:hypothetical protein